MLPFLLLAPRPEEPRTKPKVKIRESEKKKKKEKNFSLILHTSSAMQQRSLTLLWNALRLSVLQRMISTRSGGRLPNMAQRTKQKNGPSRTLHDPLAGSPVSQTGRAVLVLKAATAKLLDFGFTKLRRGSTDVRRSTPSVPFPGNDTAVLFRVELDQLVPGAELPPIKGFVA